MEKMRKRETTEEATAASNDSSSKDQPNVLNVVKWG